MSTLRTSLTIAACTLILLGLSPASDEIIRSSRRRGLRDLGNAIIDALSPPKTREQLLQERLDAADALNNALGMKDDIVFDASVAYEKAKLAHEEAES